MSLCSLLPMCNQTMTKQNWRQIFARTFFCHVTIINWLWWSQIKTGSVFIQGHKHMFEYGQEGHVLTRYQDVTELSPAILFKQSSPQIVTDKISAPTPAGLICPLQNVGYYDKEWHTETKLLWSVRLFRLCYTLLKSYSLAAVVMYVMNGGESEAE